MKHFLLLIMTISGTFFLTGNLLIAQHNFTTVFTNQNDVIKTIEVGNAVFAFTNTGYYKIPNKEIIDHSAFTLDLKILTPKINTVSKENDSTIWLGGEGTLYKLVNDSLYQIPFPSAKTIEAIAFKSNGTIFIGTWGDGLFEFDGMKWKNYTKAANSLTDNRVTALLVDDNETLWLGYHMYGIGFLDSDNLINNTNSSDYESPFDVQQLLINNSIVFIAAWDGIYIYKDNEFSQVYGSNPVTSIVIDDNDSLWIATYDKGIFKVHLNDLPMEDRDYGSESKYQKIRDKSLTEMPNYIMVDNQEKIWVSSYEGINCFSEGWEVISQPSLVDNRIMKIKFDNRHNPWIATYKGLSYFENNTWYKFPLPGLKNNIVTDLEFIDENNFWLITQDSLFNLTFDQNSKELFKNHSEGSTSWSYNSLESNGDTLYVGTWGNGIIKYYEDTKEIINLSNGLVSNYINEMKIHNNKLWISTLDGVAYIENGVITNYLKESLPVRYLYDIAVDTLNSVWISGSGGLMEFPNGDDSFIYHSKPVSYNHIAFDKLNNLWLGNGRNACLFRPSENIEIPITDNWLSTGIRDIAIETGGNIWMGTGAGLHIIDITRIVPSDNFEITYTQPVTCLDSLIISNISTSFVDSVEIKLSNDKNHSISNVNMTGNNISISQFDTTHIDIKVRNRNKYFSSNWSDLISLDLNQEQIITYDSLVICKGNVVVFNGETLSESGRYSYTSQSINGCDSISVLNLEVDVCTYLIPDVTIKEFNFFPNPAIDKLNITTNLGNGKGRLSIVNFTGKIILSKDIDLSMTSRLDISNLPSGSYVLSLATKEKVINEQFIKLK